MSINSNNFDVIYGKLLSLNYGVDRSRQLAKALYEIADSLNIEPVEMLKYVTTSGIKFDNRIFEKLNNYRTNSSQVGFLDKDNIPSSIAQQLV